MLSVFSLPFHCGCAAGRAPRSVKVLMLGVPLRLSAFLLTNQDELEQNAFKRLICVCSFIQSYVFSCRN